MTATPVEKRHRIAALFAESPLYAILDTTIRTELTCCAQLEPLLRAGVKVVQYRHKGPFGRAQSEECLELQRLTRESGGMFFVNDRADIALLCGADGVHLGQDDLSPEKARAFLGEGLAIGYSTHTVEQAVIEDQSPADYIAIGPVFPTSTKVNPDAVVGLEIVREVRRLTSKPLVAIGGITVENARSVLDAGANAIAVIKDLLAAPDIESRAREFLGALK